MSKLRYAEAKNFLVRHLMNTTSMKFRLQ